MQVVGSDRSLFPTSTGRRPALPRAIGRWDGRERKRMVGLSSREGRRSENVPRSSGMQMGKRFHLCGSQDRVNGVGRDDRSWVWVATAGYGKLGITREGS